MFTIDFYSGPDTLPIKSVRIECELVAEAVAEARKLQGQVPDADDYVVLDDLNAVMFSTFEPPLEDADDQAAAP